jgi:predicted AAA+ superfamily ATPase
VKTILNYLKNLENAFIIYHCRQYDIEGKALLKTFDIFYVCDTAMRYALLGFKNETATFALEILSILN